MFKLSCPSCAGELVFRSKDSVFAVCPYCQTTVVRHDINLETYGKMADVQLDDSPFQIGTDGKYEKRHFVLAGRMRQKWSDGYWNEWYALFDDGTAGWLAEAQGFLAMNLEVSDPESLPDIGEIHVGQVLRLSRKGLDFTVDDIKQAECVGSEGELPFRAPRGRLITSVDLVGPHNAFAGLEYGADGTRLYMGSYLDFNDFQFQGLREIDGW